MGGSFNPIHIGHLMLAEEVAFEFSYDRVVLVPSFLPPHKVLAGDPGAVHRLGMVRAAVAGDPAFIVDDCELVRKGLSYTLETIEHVIASYKLEGNPGFVIGDDLAAGFGSWRNPEGICGRAEIILARRGGSSGLMPFPHRVAHNILLPVSSTDIRTRIAAGKPWRRLVPAAVCHYIEEHKLYGKP